MFELPDDDDNFWEDLPLEDVTNTRSPKEKISSQNHDQCKSHIRGPPITAGTSFSVKQNQNSRNQTENSSGFDGKGKNIIPSSHKNSEINSFVPSRVNTLMVQPTAEKHRTSEQVEFCAGEQLKLSGGELVRGHELLTGEVRSGKRLSSESDLDPSKKMRLCEEQGAEEVYGGDHRMDSPHQARTDRQLGQTPTPQARSDHPSHSNSSGQGPQVVGSVRRPRSGQEQGHTTTPVIRKARRKFPGPAGLLPRLSGNAENSREAVVSSLKTSPEQLSIQKEDVILSSQSAEDGFLEGPWRTLMEELGAEGQQLLPNFSISSNLNKARKRQLHRGKVPLLMCVVESIDWHGCDLSVALKDHSGKIQGTIHRDIMKEFESELQVGSAIVLRQVSVISPNPRSHYLNITPANIVFIYSKQGDSCKQVNKGNASLSTVLEEVQREESSQRLQMSRAAMKTPNRNLMNGPSGQGRTPQFGVGPSDSAVSVFDKTPQNSKTKSFTSGNPQMIHRTPQTYGRQPVSTTRTPLGIQSPSENPSMRAHTPAAMSSTGAPGVRTPLHQGSNLSVPSGSNRAMNVGTPTSLSSNSPYSAGQTHGGNLPGWNPHGSSAQGRLGTQTLQSMPNNLSQVNPPEVNNNYQTPPNKRAFKFKPTRTPEIRNMSNTSAIDSTTASSVDIHSELITSSTSKSKQCDNPRFDVDWGEDLSDDMLSQLSEDF